MLLSYETLSLVLPLLLARLMPQRATKPHRVTHRPTVYHSVFTTFISTHYYIIWIDMIQTNKTLLAVLGIVLAVGFVAANSITSPASALLSLCSEDSALHTPGKGTPCVGQGNPWTGPGLTGNNPGQHQLKP